jgi:NifU-like protein involved in Fe-S cluster formation
MSAPLYNADILRLAMETAGFSRLARPMGSAERRSPVCGSRVIVDVALDKDGRISDVGIEARACALGQSSAALMATHAKGHSRSELEAAREALAAYLAGTRDDPGAWPGLEIFAPARAHSARHAAILLSFQAAVDAITQAGGD